MIVDAKLNGKYNLFRPYFEFIQDLLDQTLMNYSKKNLFAYTSRIKEINSISEKIETGRYSSWTDIDDFIGCVIIVPNLSYEHEVLKFLEQAFVKIDIRKKGSTFKNYDTFRFDSTRFIGKIKSVNNSMNLEIQNIKFEIQIRSAFEHAWSVTTHDLAYKSSNIDWQMLRLAAQLKSSVEQLDMIALGAKNASKNITKHQWPEIEIKIEILNFIKEGFDSGKIPNELEPKDFSRVVDNIFSLIKSKLNIWKSKKWKSELKIIFGKVDEEIERLNHVGFPMSLSLYQIIFGILAKNEILSNNELMNLVFFKCESFTTIFPELASAKFREFEV